MSKRLCQDPFLSWCWRRGIGLSHPNAFRLSTADGTLLTTVAVEANKCIAVVPILGNCVTASRLMEEPSMCPIELPSRIPGAPSHVDDTFILAWWLAAEASRRDDAVNAMSLFVRRLFLRDVATDGIMTAHEESMCREFVKPRYEIVSRQKAAPPYGSVVRAWRAVQRRTLMVPEVTVLSDAEQQTNRREQQQESPTNDVASLGLPEPTPTLVPFVSHLLPNTTSHQNGGERSSANVSVDFVPSFDWALCRRTHRHHLCANRQRAPPRADPSSSSSSLSAPCLVVQTRFALEPGTQLIADR
eukprot:PhM_4_TR626/c0_g1_i1/m.30050